MAVNANSAVQSSAAERSSNRRTIIKGAAWTVPVIAAAVAAPAASASEGTTPEPVFYDWSVGGSASVGSGNNAFFTVNGQDPDGQSAVLPGGFTFLIPAAAGVEYVINSSPGFINVVLEADGSITGMVIPDYNGVPRINFKVTGPVGTKIMMTATGPFEPFVDSKELTIRASA